MDVVPPILRCGLHRMHRSIASSPGRTRVMWVDSIYSRRAANDRRWEDKVVRVSELFDSLDKVILLHRKRKGNVVRAMFVSVLVTNAFVGIYVWAGYLLACYVSMLLVYWSSTCTLLIRPPQPGVVAFDYLMYNPVPSAL